MSVPVVSRVEYEAVGEQQVRMQLSFPDAFALERETQLGEAYLLWAVNDKVGPEGFSKKRWKLSPETRDSISMMLDVTEGDPTRHIILEHRETPPYNNYTGLRLGQLPICILKNALMQEIIRIKVSKVPIIQEVHQWLDTESDNVSWRAWVNLYLPLFNDTGELRHIAIVSRAIERNIVPLSSALQQSILNT
ncbi:MAG: hypothetical protein OXT01_18410 [Rhodospirillaceae bacterium]|nr:hypothetical protein [Rhodospirillaceae bacterium]